MLAPVRRVAGLTHVTGLTRFRPGSVVRGGVIVVSSQTVLALLPLLLLVIALDGYALLILIRSPAARRLPKPAWAALILASAPFGALAYLALGRSPDGDDPDVAPRTDVEPTATRRG